MRLSRKVKRENEKARRKIAEDFAAYLSATHKDRLPRPGYYVPSEDDKDWEYLDGETVETQDRRAEEITDDTVFAFGVYAEGEDRDTVSVVPQLIVLP